MGMKNIIGNLTVDGSLVVNDELTVNNSKVTTEDSLATVATSGSYADLSDKPTINGVEVTGAKTSTNLKLGLVTSVGGFQAGTDASATIGGAVGNQAKETAGGGAVGNSASAGYGGAIGYQASATAGGAVGYTAKTTLGGAIGHSASAGYGGAIGRSANATTGFAGGYNANARYKADGTTEITGAVAIGYDAKAQAAQACQLGTGTNTIANTLQFRDYQLLDVDGKIPTDRLSEDVYTSLASGQAIEKIVFNSNVSLEKMTNYLSSLSYNEPIQGINSVCKLVGIDREEDTLSVYAIDFSALNVIVPNTSGYGIAVIDTTGSDFVLKQGVFTSEYSEANATLVNAIKDPNYVLNYTQAGWSDTNDYVLDTSDTHTIYSVHDNKVSAFIGRASRFFEVVEMLDDGVDDYSDLENKPSINGVLLEGDLTTTDLEIQNGLIWIDNASLTENEDGTFKLNASRKYPIGSFLVNV